jgi:uncharacterized repeat protein (TIGR03987 family)
LNELFGMIIISLAFICYSIGVWSERFSARLKVGHVVFFWFGIIFDTWGTGMMFELAGGLTYDIHGLTGLLAIVLMLIHAIWATTVLLKKDEILISSFHRFSVTVWVIWLIPYLSPVVIMIPKPA